MIGFTNTLKKPIWSYICRWTLSTHWDISKDKILYMCTQKCCFSFLHVHPSAFTQNRLLSKIQNVNLEGISDFVHIFHIFLHLNITRCSYLLLFVQCVFLYMRRWPGRVREKCRTTGILTSDLPSSSCVWSLFSHCPSQKKLVSRNTQGTWCFTYVWSASC